VNVFGGEIRGTGPSGNLAIVGRQLAHATRRERRFRSVMGLGNFPAVAKLEPPRRRSTSSCAASWCVGRNGGQGPAQSISCDRERDPMSAFLFTLRCRVRTTPRPQGGDQHRHRCHDDQLRAERATTASFGFGLHRENVSAAPDRLM